MGAKFPEYALEAILVTRKRINRRRTYLIENFKIGRVDRAFFRGILVMTGKPSLHTLAGVAEGRCGGNTLAGQKTLPATSPYSVVA